jgi:hypothetical protein
MIVDTRRDEGQPGRGAMLDQLDQRIGVQVGAD